MEMDNNSGLKSPQPDESCEASEEFPTWTLLASEVTTEIENNPPVELVVDFDTEEFVPMVPAPGSPPPPASVHENRQVIGVCRCSLGPESLVAPPPPAAQGQAQDVAASAMAIDRILTLALPLWNRKATVAAPNLGTEIPCGDSAQAIPDIPEPSETAERETEQIHYGSNTHSVNFNIPPEKVLEFVANLLVENGDGGNSSAWSEERRIAVLRIQNIIEEYRMGTANNAGKQPSTRLGDEVTGSAIPIVDLTLDDEIKIEFNDSEDEFMMMRNSMNRNQNVNVAVPDAGSGRAGTPSSTVEKLLEIERALRWTVGIDNLDNFILEPKPAEDVQDHEANGLQNIESRVTNRNDINISRERDNQDEPSMARNALQCKENNGVSLEAGKMSNLNDRPEPIVLGVNHRGTHQLRECSVHLTRLYFLPTPPCIIQPGKICKLLTPIKEPLIHNDVGLIEVDNEQNGQRVGTAIQGDTCMEIEDNAESANAKSPTQKYKYIEIEMSSSSSESDYAPSSTNAQDTLKKRGRGRPRKFPISRKRKSKFENHVSLRRSGRIQNLPSRNIVYSRSRSSSSSSSSGSSVSTFSPPRRRNRVSGATRRRSVTTRKRPKRNCQRTRKDKCDTERRSSQQTADSNVQVEEPTLLHQPPDDVEVETSRQSRLRRRNGCVDYSQ